jgi:hypothetical protein
MARFLENNRLSVNVSDTAGSVFSAETPCEFPNAMALRCASIFLDFSGLGRKLWRQYRRNQQTHGLKWLKKVAIGDESFSTGTVEYPG